MVTNGTTYNDRTPARVIEILEQYRINGKHLRIHYGNTDGENAGQDWYEENDVSGRVGRSMGPVKIPLLIKPGDDGGPGILDHCIVRIRDSKGADLYRHPSYRHGTAEIIAIDDGKYKAEVKIDGQTYARFRSIKSAQKYAHDLGIA